MMEIMTNLKNEKEKWWKLQANPTKIFKIEPNYEKYKKELMSSKKL